MQLVFKSGLSIGAISAEDDEQLLRDCYISTGAANEIKNMSGNKCIVLGRTGAGKSAILWDIEDKETNTIRIKPDSLSLNFIANSDIIRFFEEADIKLDVFYQLLWRHIFAVELIKSKQKIYDKNKSDSWIATLFQRMGENDKKKKALEYLFEFGNSFWADTEERVREVVKNIEEKFTSESGLDLKAWILRLSGKSHNEKIEASQEIREIIHKAQTVVNKIQIQELENVIEFLSEDIFEDRYEKYYIIIDDLDTEWANDSIRFKLVRALIETIKKFKRIRNVKIIISMRNDLLQTVLEKTSEAGFQREKYDDLFLQLRWTRDQLWNLADERISRLFKDQYTNAKIGLSDVLASKVGDSEGFSYILDRTLYRPRDVIAFLNECFVIAVGQTKLSNRVVRDAEIEYSTKRMSSLADEWREVYGDLEPTFRFLKVLGPKFEGSKFDNKMAEDYCIFILNDLPVNLKRRAFVAECNAFMGGTLSFSHLKNSVLGALYIVGAIGVKLDATSRHEWSYINSPKLDYNRINDDSKFAIHPMLFKALGVFADPKSIN